METLLEVLRAFTPVAGCWWWRAVLYGVSDGPGWYGSRDGAGAAPSVPGCSGPFAPFAATSVRCRASLTVYREPTMA